MERCIHVCSNNLRNDTTEYHNSLLGSDLLRVLVNLTDFSLTWISTLSGAQRNLLLFSIFVRLDQSKADNSVTCKIYFIKKIIDQVKSAPNPLDLQVIYYIYDTIAFSLT